MTTIPETYYIDCNRQNASIKSDELKNEWVNVLQNPIKLNAGSEISIQNSFVNYKGLSGGSVELLEDYNITMKGAFYLSHTDYLAIKSVSNTVSQIYNIADVFSNFTTDGINGIYYNNFEEVNYDKLLSPGLKTKLETLIVLDGIPPNANFPTAPYDILSQGRAGYTEQPLFAVYCDTQGNLRPVIDDIIINVEKGIYGINELSDNIQDQINGLRKPYNTLFNNDTKFNESQIQYFNGSYDSSLQSQLLKKFDIWDYRISGNVNASDIISNLTNIELATLTNKGPIYITASKYDELLRLLKNNITDDPNFKIKSFCLNNYYMVMKRIVDIQGIPTNISGNRIYDEPSNPVQFGASIQDQRVWDYNPYGNGYYLGTSSFLFSYDSEKSGFSIQYLHEPRRQPSHDNLGNKNEQEGQIVSFIKKFNSPDFFDTVGLTTEEKRKVLNSIENPRSRSSGVCIINWDLNTAIEKSGKNEINIGNRIDYFDWEDFFDTKKEAEKQWQNTLWFKLGFSYDQLQDRYSREDVRSYDLVSIKLPGFTTNNTLDSSIVNTISGDYCPLQGNSSTDKFNPTLPYVIQDEVKQYGIDLPAKNYFKINTNTYQNWKNVYYLDTQTYPVLTQSNSLVAKFLPDLSEQGYFLITSDIIDGFKDTVKKGDPLGLLGVVPKSSLSNQDFISSFQEITQRTTQDKIINQIKIKILNPDLTNPILNSRSSVILKIVNNVPQIQKKK